MVSDELLAGIVGKLRIVDYSENMNLVRMLYMIYRLDLDITYPKTWLQRLFKYFDDDIHFLLFP